MTAVLLACLWALPIAEQIAHARDGNISKVVEYFITKPPAERPAGRVLSAFSHYVLGPFSSGVVSPLGHRSPQGLPQWEVWTFGILAVASIALAWRHRREFEATLLWIVAAATAASLLAASRITVAFSDYQLFWTGVFAPLAVAAIVSLVFRRGPSPRASLAFSLAAILVIAGVTARNIRAWQQTMADEHSVRDIAAAINNYATANGLDRPVLAPTQSTWAECVGVVLLGAKRDRPIALVEDFTNMVGARYVGSSNGRTLSVYDAAIDSKAIGQAGDRIAVRRDRFAVVDSHSPRR